MRIGKLKQLLAELREWEPDVVHVQYPAAAYRKGFGPVALMARRGWRRVVTVHEFSGSHCLRRCVVATLLRLCDAAVFTTKSELDACGKWVPRLRRIATVVPIGSNLGTEFNVGGSDRSDEVVYFGLIRPKKGVEEFLELAGQAKARGLEWRFVVIGRTPRGCEGYERKLRARSSMVGNVVWVGGLEEAEALRRMGAAKVAYLPYPDGVSERRGSALACLSAGLAVVTTDGKETTEELRRVVVIAEPGEGALQAIEWLMRDELARERLRREGVSYVRKRGWEVIAERHLAVYRRVMRGSGTG
jgi:glycosyltransferase involved in cell wall biosynthesis